MKKIIIVLTIVLIVASMSNNSIINVSASSEVFGINFIDVAPEGNQGDATLIDCNGKYILVDGGLESTFDTKLKKFLDSYCKKTEVEKDVFKIEFEYIILTHNDQDHDGGIRRILNDTKNYKVKNIYRTQLFKKQSIEDAVSKANKENKTKDIVLMPIYTEKKIDGKTEIVDTGNVKTHTVNGTTIKIFGPLNYGFVDRNKQSMAVKVEGKNSNTSCIILGDQTEKGVKALGDVYEKDLFKTSMPFKICKLGHHGVRGNKLNSTGIVASAVKREVDFFHENFKADLYFLSTSKGRVYNDIALTALQKKVDEDVAKVNAEIKKGTYKTNDEIEKALNTANDPIRVRKNFDYLMANLTGFKKDIHTAYNGNLKLTWKRRDPIASSINVSETRLWSTMRTKDEIADKKNTNLIGNESGLMQLWKLDGRNRKSGDIIANKKAGGINAQVSGQLSPNIGLQFDYASTYVETDNKISTGHLQTVEIVAKINEGGKRQILFGNYSGKGNCMNFEITDKNELRFYEKNGDTATAADIKSSAIKIDKDKWTTLSFVRDFQNKKVILYQDGKPIGEGNKNMAMDNNATQTLNHRIGSDQRASSKIFFDGVISEVRLWNKPRTDDQIRNNKNTNLIGNEQDLVQLWALNDQALKSGSAITNKKTGGTNAKLQGRFLPNMSLQFDNESTFVEADQVLSNGILRSGNNPWTMEVVTRLNAGGKRHILFGNYLDPKSNCINFEVTAENYLRYYEINNNGTVVDIKSTGKITVDSNKWTTFSFVVHPAKKSVTFFQDGNQIGSTVVNNNMTEAINSQPLKHRIGSDQRASSKIFFDGVISEVRLWNTDRTDQLKNKNTINTNLVGNESGLTQLWALDDQVLNIQNAVVTNKKAGGMKAKVHGRFLPNTSLQFENASTCVQISKTMDTNPKTVEIVAKINEGGKRHILFGNYYSGPGNYMNFEITDDNKLRYYEVSGTTVADIKSKEITIKKNKWTTLSFVRNVKKDGESVITFYQDGVEIGVVKSDMIAYPEKSQTLKYRIGIDQRAG